MHPLRRVALGAALFTACASWADRSEAQAAPPGLHQPGDPPEQVAPAAAEQVRPEWQEAHDRKDEREPSEFSFISYFFARATLTNQLADPAGLRGVSLGPIGAGESIGSATRVGDKSTNWYIEQRWIPVIGYSPHFVNGLATVRAQFEIDYSWGLAANTVQNNQGGGFNADQVNIQTKNINVGLYPTKNPKQLSILIGTHSVYDTIYDPTITSLFDIVQTGYKLSFMGTDATGISAFANTRYGLGKLSFIPVGSAQPNKALQGDARFERIYLFTADYAYPFQPGTVAGLSLWHLRDDTQGQAFAYEGLVPSGPSSGALSAFTGTAPFSIEEPNGHVTWLGAHFHHNLQFRTGDFAASGFTMANFGRFDSQKEDTLLNQSVSIRGFASNLELLYNWGNTIDDKITLEGMFTSGDDDVNDDTYKSAFTMNYYGLPGAVWFNHKTLVLFPFTSTVNNYTGAVTDISNRGFGLLSGIATISRDLVPSKLNVKLGAAYGQSIQPPTAIGGVRGGRVIGAEVNAEVKYHFRYLMTAGLHAGYLFRGNFYDGNSQVTSNPWATFGTFTWYAF
jgi:hypothetical protein